MDLYKLFKVHKSKRMSPNTVRMVCEEALNEHRALLKRVRKHVSGQTREKIDQLLWDLNRDIPAHEAFLHYRLSLKEVLHCIEHDFDILEGQQ